MTYFAVRISGKPADEEHHYGHGKVESVTALAETALLFLLSAVVIWEAGQRLFGGQGHAVEASVWAFGVIIGLDRGRFLPRAPALPRRRRDIERGARSRRAAFRLRHVVVDRGAGRACAASRSAFRWADAIAALVVAVFDLRRRLAARPPHRRDPDRHRAGRRGGRISGIGRERARRGRGRAGAGAAVGTGPVRRSRASRSAARCRSTASPPSRPPSRAAIKAEMPEAEVNVTTEPRALDDETVLERVMVIARNRALAVHHVTVHAIGGTALGLARSRGRRQPDARAGARNRGRAGGRGARRARPRWSRSRPISSRCRRADLPAATRRPVRIVAVRDALTEAAARHRRSCATCTTCACARPRTARSSISTAASIRLSPYRRCTRRSMSWSARCGDFAAVKRVIGHAEPRAPKS